MNDLIFFLIFNCELHKDTAKLDQWSKWIPSVAPLMDKLCGMTSNHLEGDCFELYFEIFLNIQILS